MTKTRALRLAMQWSKDRVCSVREGEAEEYHKMFAEMLQAERTRDERMQWLDDMNNPLEPIKLNAALKSELLKFEYRREHAPESISELDITIICALQECLEENLGKS